MYNPYIAPRAETAAAAALLCHIQSGRTAYRRKLSLRPQTLTYNQTAIRSPGPVSYTHLTLPTIYSV